MLLLILLFQNDILKLIGYVGKKREDQARRMIFIFRTKKVRKNYPLEPAVVTRNSLTNEVESKVYFMKILILRH